MKLKDKLIFLIVIFTVCMALDQYTKYLAEEYLKGREGYSYFYDTFRLEFATNKGAFLSLFSGLSDQWRFILLTVFTGLILAFVLGLMLLKESPFYDYIGFCLLFSGGMGNLVDRIAQGEVVDMFNMGIGSLRTGIFNIADVAIMVGIFIIFILQLKRSRDEKRQLAETNDKEEITSVS